MRELMISEQMEVQGGSIAAIIIYAVIIVGAYKIFCSSAGRICVPRLISLEWYK